METTNPWVRSIDEASADDDVPAGVLTAPRPAAALAPQPAVVRLGHSERFARRTLRASDAMDLWWVGAHGGARREHA